MTDRPNPANQIMIELFIPPSDARPTPGTIMDLVHGLRQNGGTQQCLQHHFSFPCGDLCGMQWKHAAYAAYAGTSLTQPASCGSCERATLHVP